MSANQDFNNDRTLGELAEKELISILSLRPDTLSVTKVDHNSHNYDIHLILKKGAYDCSEIRIEVKSLRGGYPTGVVEVWANDNKTKRPHWWGHCDYIIFKDRRTRTWYLYKEGPFVEWLKSQTDLVRANNGSECDSGWIKKFVWDGTPGFVYKFESQITYL